LLSGYRGDPVTSLLIADYDWFIMPVVNPDGYEFSNSTVHYIALDYKPFVEA